MTLWQRRPPFLPAVAERLSSVSRPQLIFDRQAQSGTVTIVRPAIRLQRKLLILCIEDNKTHLRLRKAVLERNGYFVVGAGNAADAMRLFRKHPVCLVLTDHMLRGATGIQLATRMKRLKAEVPLVLYSGKPPESMQNVDCFIHKGESPEHFLSMISNLVKRSAQ